jgi:F-type H+-transporting ATPase subunit a
MPSSLLRFVQEQAVPAVDAAQPGATESGPDLGGMIMHHLVDAREWELPGFTLHLPQGWNVNLGPLGMVDLAPTKHVLLMLLAAALCFVVFTLVARSVRRRDPGKAPTGFANGAESMVLFFRNEVVRPNIGHGADAYTPYILTLFFFILVMNLLGLVPWGGSATGNLSVTAALAICTFILVEVSGMRALGAKGYMRTIFYAPHGMHPVGQAIMLVIMTPVEFMGKLTKPFALAIRLFANMTAGHTLILSLLGIIFVFGNLSFGRWGVAGASVAMSTAIMVLEVFVAFLQAYIFAMLTAVFVGLIRHAH